MDELNIFDDYKSFIQENDKLVSTLIKNKSVIISRFIPVLKVLNHLYYAHFLRKLNDDEITFFNTGFDYIFDVVHLINTILETKFNNIEDMEKCSLTINLFLYINEIRNEIKQFKPSSIKNEMIKLNEISKHVDKCIDKKENIQEEYFQLFDDIITDIFEKNDAEINTIDNIFYEIALEYNLEIEEYDYTFMDEMTKRIVQ